jgi:DNA-binding LacI/PurR family transcriptional regulator
MPTYSIVLPDGRPHFTDVSRREVEAICQDLGYSPEHVLRKLRRNGRVTLSDDVGEFSIEQQ